MKAIMPLQCRAARVLLRLKAEALAEYAGVSRSCLIEFEGGKRVPWGGNMAKIVKALEDRGARFVSGGVVLADHEEEASKPEPKVLHPTLARLVK